MTGNQSRKIEQILRVMILLLYTYDNQRHRRNAAPLPDNVV